MHTLSLALTSILLLAFVLFMAPSVIAMNRGKVLRNIAIWLAIFAGLGLFYKNFGPGKEPSEVPAATASSNPAPSPSADKNFTPPKE